MMEASPSGKISSKLVVHFLRNTGSIKNEREASPQRNNHFNDMLENSLTLCSASTREFISSFIVSYEPSLFR